MTAATRTLKLRYFASLREALGTDRESVTTAADTVGALRQELIARSDAHADALALGKAVRVRHIPGPALLQMWKWMDRPPVEELAGPVDVFHSPATYIPPQLSGAAVTL